MIPQGYQRLSVTACVMTDLRRDRNLDGWILSDTRVLESSKSRLACMFERNFEVPS